MLARGVLLARSGVGERIQPGEGYWEGSQQASLDLHDSEPPRTLAGRSGHLSLAGQTSPGWQQVQAGERHPFSTRRALKASWGCCDNAGLQTKDLGASRSSSWGHSLAHQRHIQLDSPRRTAKDTSDCLGLWALWKPFGTGRYKNKEDFHFKNSVFRASWDMLGPD